MRRANASDRGGYSGEVIILASIALLIEVMLWVGLALLGMTAWSWVGALGAFVAALLVWAVFMSPKGRWRLAPWPRAIIAVGLCLVVGMNLVDTGWVTYGVLLTIGGVVLGVAELVLPDIRVARGDATPLRHPYNL